MTFLSDSGGLGGYGQSFTTTIPKPSTTPSQMVGFQLTETNWENNGYSIALTAPWLKALGHVTSGYQHELTAIGYLQTPAGAAPDWSSSWELHNSFSEVIGVGIQTTSTAPVQATGDTNYHMTLPAPPTAGDILLLAHVYGGLGQPATPSGWTLVYTRGLTSPDGQPYRMGLYVRCAGVGESANIDGLNAATTRNYNHLTEWSTSDPVPPIPTEPPPLPRDSWRHNGESKDPVGTFSGDFRYSFTDLAIPGRGPSPAFVRAYNSAETRTGRLGPGWTDNYSVRLRHPSAGSDDLSFVGPNGNTDTYTHNPDDTFSPPPAVYRTLVRNPDGTYTATELDNSTWTFDGSGNLVAIADRFGNSSILAYNPQGELVSVSDPAGRGSLTLAYTGGLLTSVTDWASPPRTVSYQYDPNGRLWKVTNRENQTTTFAYDGTSQRLTSITDANGHVAVTMTYDAQVRVATQKDAQGLVTGATTTFAYVVNGDGTRVTTVTYPATSFEPSFSPTVTDSHNAQGWLTQRVSRPTSTETLTQSFGYDATGNQTSITDARGNTTDLCYDVDYAGTVIAGSRGNLTRRIDPAPTTGANRPVTLFAYDARNNPTQVVAPKGVPSGTTVACSTNLSAINSLYATDMTYDASGALLVSTTTRFTDPDTGPQTAVSKFEYGDAANPGLVTRVIPPRGNTGPSPDYTYATTLTYGATGFQAGMLTATADALGNTTTYEYDLVGRRTKVVDPLGNAAGGVAAEHATEYIYDIEDRVRFLNAPAPQAGGTQLVTEYRYDAVGNRTVQIDANGQVTTYTYDERDGLFQVKESPLAWTDPATPPATVITTEYAYDAAGNLTRMSRAKGDASNERVTDYAYDGRGLVRAETQYPSWPSTSPTLVTTSAYDANGNPATVVDPLGQTTTSSYDRLNQLTAIDYSEPATPDVTYAYDANGNRISMVDGTGSTTYLYDEANRLTSVTSPGPKTVGYRYDLDGNRTKLIYPDGTAVTYSFNKASQLASLVDWASRSVGYTYWPDGALKTATNPDTSVATYAYDNARRVTDISHQFGAIVIGQYAYTQDAVGNVMGFLDGAASISIDRVSVASGGAQANGSNTIPSISGDGRYVAFESIASNLVPGDTNGQYDIFVRDLQSGTTSRASVATGGTQATSDSFSPSISADGRYVAFESASGNLVVGDTNGTSDVFVRDVKSGTTARVSVTSSGAQTNGQAASTNPSISADGRYVAFDSNGTNLGGPGSSTDPNNVFVRDLQSGTTSQVSLATGGIQGNGGSSNSSISADGRFVAFQSVDSLLVAGDTNGASDVFLHDRQSGTTSRVSVATGGGQANGGGSPNFGSGSPSISADGRDVAFGSWASNLVPGDTNGADDIFVHDRLSGTTSRVSVAAGGGQANGGSFGHSISADGRYVSFDSSANNLVSSDTNGANDIFVHDRQSGTTSRVSIASSGAQATAYSSTPSINADGRYIAFYSIAANLVAGDTNATHDVFVTGRGGQSTYGYDRLYRLTSAAGPDGQRTYTYDPAGNRVSLTSGGTTTYGYDRSDRILSLVEPPTAASSTRPPSSNDAGWTSGTNAYASDNIYATSAPAKSTTTAIKVGTFGFDTTIPASATITNVTVTVEWKVSTTASNATLGAQALVSGAAVGTELVNTAEPTSDTTQSFTVSGLTRPQLLNGVLQVRVRATRGNSNTAFTASLDAVSVKVDYAAPSTTILTTNANGNLVAKGSSTFMYDQANRLTSATVAGASETYAYDGDGVRFSRTVGANPASRYVSDVNTSLPVTVDDGTRKYVWGLGLAYAVSGSAIEIYHTDRLGSVRVITDASGAVTATYRTDEYGVPTASTGPSTQPFGFTGEPRDSTGLSYLRARYYDPSLGRFMSRDAWSGAGWVPSTLHRYAYVGSNPATFTDPSGRAGPALACATPITAPLCAEAAAAAVNGILWVGGAIIGLALGEAVFEARGNPTHVPWTPPAPDPDLGRAIQWLIELNTPDVHIGLPGGSRLPELCRRHKTACTAALLAVTGVAGTLLVALGGPEKLEERYWEGPETEEEQHAPKPHVLR